MSLIDIHFHGTKKIDIKEADNPEKILLIAKDYGLTGVDGILLTLYPAEIGDIKKTLLNVKKAIEIQSQGAKIYGVYLEGPFLNPVQAGALNYRYFLKPDIDILYRLFDGAEEIIKIITIAPELPGALKIIEKCYEMGIIVSLGHSNATFKQAQEAFRAGARLITHLFNAMRGIHHREPGLAGFGLINQEVYIELIADGRHLSDQLLQWIFKIKNSEKIILVSDMVKEKSGIQKLQGGTMSLYDIVKRVERLNIDSEKVKIATENNPHTLLGISFL